MAKKILIAGGTGFLGFHLTKYFKEKKFKVYVLHKNKINKKKIITNVKYIQVNISDFKKLKKKIKNISFNYLINVSGYVNHSLNKNEDDKIINDYFQSVVNLSEISKKKSFLKFIQIGSSEEYGSTNTKQIEDRNNNPDTPYGFSRLISTSFLKMLSSDFNFPVIIFRVFLIYGPHQKNNRIIPYLVENSIKNNLLKIKNKNNVRDFLYIEDFLKIIDLSLSNKKMNGQIFNVGYGNKVKIYELINLIKLLTNSKSKIKYSSNNNSLNKKIHLPSLKKIFKFTNWKPLININEGLKHTINYYKNNK